ncbi:peroxiredoxin-like family protein [Oricola cellulosilytica]|uniref:AhpC/TSA family protein n=1 Tax=Oricola cellulosilytica TaxID=1429082 RepID=A0A4R0PFA1_9HYPH|nr:peroxiredoxin-like family protein [Oricola cellulosilytica]TCD14164.1 AhpC/TSA family protein [Oricola cellulosilytica]
MSLNKRLKFLGDTMWRNACCEDQQVRDLALQNQSQYATEEGRIVNHPESVPDIELISADGNRQSVHSLIEGKPAVVLFFRGSWCPYSTTSMRALEGIRVDLSRHGVAMIGVTPQRHITLAAATSRNALGYPLLTDPEQAFAEAMGVRVKIIDEMINMYQCQGFDLTKLNESGDWSLPLEATFLVDSSGQVVEANAYPYPTRRMEPEEIRGRMLALADQRQFA